MKRITAVSAILIMASAAAGCQTVTGRTARQHISDKWLTHETKATIVAANLRALTAVDVDVNHGIVYLTGTVATPEHKASTEEAARSVEGVRDVVSHLQIQGQPTRTSP